MTLGEKIAEQRKLMGYTQTELANLMGEKSAGVISNWENDVNKPDVEKMARLCTLFKCPVAYFIENGQNLDITEDELTILQKLRMLDEFGKSVVLCNLDYQYNRCISLGIEKNEKDNSKDNSVFVAKKDTDYNIMKEKCKELIALKKGSFLSESEIRLLLSYGHGYTGKISIADLVLLFHGMKVPSNELYNDIRTILERTQTKGEK